MADDDLERQWQVTVSIPYRLGTEVFDGLLTAITNAAYEWQPEDRKGWDVFIVGSPQDGCECHRR